MNTQFKRYRLPSIFHLVATVLALFISIEVVAQTTEYAILRDVSEIPNEQCILEEAEVFRTVLTQLDLQGSSKGVTLRTATFGANRIPDIQIAELPEQNRFFSSSTQRDDHLRKFLTKAKQDIELMASEPCGQSQTNLYRALVHISQQIDLKVDQKFLVVISDFILVSSAFNFNTYANNPAAIVGEDYEAIVEALKRDGELPDMSGMEVVLVTPQINDRQMWAARFWKKFFVQEKGAQVIIRASF